MRALLLLFVAAAGAVAAATMAGARAMPCDGSLLSPAVVPRLAEIARTNIGTEYPNLIHHTMQSDADVQPPRKLTPAFYGSYDWHSAVHSHWQLVRLIRTFPNASFEGAVRAALDAHLTEANLAAEAAYMTGEGRGGFERPYGLAWLLQLVAELAEWNDPQGNTIGQWRAHLLPVEQAAVQSLSTWLPKLTHPIRIGEHSQTAFAMGLVLDYARTVGNQELADLLVERARTFHLGDTNCPLHMEPSGHDFLSACWGAADLMRRILPPAEFAEWLGTALPTVPRGGADPTWLVPVNVSDPTDGKLAHFDGLNLSRAWMLSGVAAGLPAGDDRLPALEAAAEAHAQAGLAAVERDMDYAGSHWLGSFAVYLATCRGLTPSSAAPPV